MAVPSLVVLAVYYDPRELERQRIAVGRVHHGQRRDCFHRFQQMAGQAQKLADLRKWVSENVMATIEAAEYLGVSRQAIHLAVKRGALVTVKEGLFLKSDLDEYDKTAEKMRPKSYKRNQD